jgi:hypothetical protein
LKNGDAKPWVYNCKRSHDSQVAEDKIAGTIFASLVKLPGLFFLNLIISSFDKGKPVEKRGRKAKDLKSRAA